MRRVHANKNRPDERSSGRFFVYLQTASEEVMWDLGSKTSIIYGLCGLFFIEVREQFVEIDISVRGQPTTNLLLFDLTRDLSRRLEILDAGVATEPNIESTTDLGIRAGVTAVFEGAIQGTPKGGFDFRRAVSTIEQKSERVGQNGVDLVRRGQSVPRVLLAIDGMTDGVDRTGALRRCPLSRRPRRNRGARNTFRRRRRVGCRGVVCAWRPP